MSRLGTQLFEATGAPADQAGLAARELVTSSLMGFDSHGVIRITEYLDSVARGLIVPGAPLVLDLRSEATAVADCGDNFGAVGAHFAMDAAIRLARVHRVSCVVTRRCTHVGRLGAYVQLAAERGMIALATCNSPFEGHCVLPWGGRDGRLGTNPIAYGVPTSGDPIVADIATSIAPEGKIRFHRNEGKPVPEGWILDAEGRTTTDPNQFYGPPRGGILPFGGAVGHKGFALGLLVEILGSALAGRSSIDPNLAGNGLCFVALDPSAFLPLAAFRQLMDELVTYIKSSRPVDPDGIVLVPGEREFRTMSERASAGIPIDEVTVREIEAHAQRLGLAAVDWAAA
jgi:uncharacterized oxidoreductase